MSLPSLSFDLGWAHVKFIDDTLNGFEGSMDWEKRDGDKRPYRFEAYYELETWKATISACDPENPNPFEDRNMGAAPFRPIKGLSKGDRRDIAKRAEDNAARLRKQVEEQRKWLLGRFTAATLILPTVRHAAYALDGEWLICRNRIMRDDGFDVSATRRGFPATGTGLCRRTPRQGPAPGLIASGRPNLAVRLQERNPRPRNRPQPLRQARPRAQTRQRPSRRLQLRHLRRRSEGSRPCRGS
jgi:hypothetical protein